MDENKTYNLLAIDANYCPKYDKPVTRGDCTGCEFYKGFELYHAQPCIKCAFSTTMEKEN